MTPKKTHRLVEKPQISGRYLADYMAGSERARRRIAQQCKYQAIARIIQHDEAKSAISRYFWDHGKAADLANAASGLRSRMTHTEFDRDVLDHNADYLDRFLKELPKVELPDADISTPGNIQNTYLNAVKVTADIAFRLQRTTRTNKVKIGAAMLRYQKGKALNAEVAEWQSAFLHGFLAATWPDTEAEPEPKLCITIDAYTGEVYPAPTDSVSRFKNMEAACASIAERWPNIDPPPNAVL